MLWEMFSLAEDPWPEVSSPQGLTDLLTSGSRLPEVTGAPDGVTSLMGRCWSAEPRMRPSPGDIVDTLRSVMTNKGTTTGVEEEDTSRGHYKIPNQIVPSRSFYWTHYKVLKGNPVTVTANKTESSDHNDKLSDV